MSGEAVGGRARVRTPARDAASGDTGSLAWARRTGGVLTPAERRRLVRQGVALQIRSFPHQVLGLVGIHPRRIRHLDERLIEPPDSGAARAAEHLAEELLSPALRNHSQRTFAFARLLAADDGIEHDVELLYVACLLHDLGLAGEIRNGPERAACFTLAGAERAESLAGDAGWGAERAHRLADAVTRHLGLHVDPAANLEGHLVGVGAFLDTIGLRAWRLSRPVLREVTSRHPRLSAKRELAAVFAEEAAARPHTRAWVYDRRLAARLAFRLAPFDE